MTYAELWNEQWMMHEWVREFCHAHNFAINTKKTKFIISNVKENDARWLPSVDGKERITPLPSSHQFRYLGLWMSMDLNWDTQRQMMNKSIMNWRWKLFVSKADPIFVKTSIVEWLLPRLEIGFLHANITKKMCEAWLSTIIETLARLGDMSSTVKSINRQAFCSLAGLPDIWLRLNTIRATELMVNLNTRICLCGKSTVARFCSFMGQKANEMKKAIQDFDRKGSVKCRVSNRLSSTLQFLKQNSLSIIHQIQSSDGPTKLVEEIKQSLANLRIQSIIVYTDGSTNPRLNHPNSGCSVIITDRDIN